MITKIIAGFQYVSRSYIPSSPHPVYPAIVEFIFYGNYFYGICVVALSIEATVQQFFPLNNSVYYFFVCCITVLYYDYPYVRRYKSAGDNSRTAWYIKNYNLVRWNQIIITAILLSAFVVLTYWYRSNIQHMGLVNWVLLLIFPAGASLYYGINFLSRRYNLRSIGWLKPFIIGFSWAGLVTIYPILYYAIVNNQNYQPTVIGLLLFLKNFMYIALLAIMFDVKDYVTDYASKLKTFVVKIGLRKTILFILLPLPVVGLFIFICYAVLHQFHFMKILLNTIPFILLLVAASSLRKRRSLMYYLVVIDGLMLIKAIFGITAMLLF